MIPKQIVKYAENRDTALMAGKDFLSQVIVKHSDGSKFKLRFAKLEILEQYIIVYTEHNDILYFHAGDVDYVKIAALDKKLKPTKYRTVFKEGFEFCQNCLTYKPAKDMDGESDGYCKKCC